MRKAIKKNGKLVKAYQLGKEHPVTKKLMREGKIRQIDENTFELFSQEAVNGHGQAAYIHDWYKIDSTGSPYPNSRQFFEENHRCIRREEDEYEQIPKPVSVWAVGDVMCPEMEYLLRERIVVDESSEDKYFSAELWGTLLSAKRDAFVVIYDVKKDDNGNILDIDFSFVENSEFHKTYDLPDS